MTAASDSVSSHLCRVIVMSASNDKNVVPPSKYKPTQLPILTTFSVYTDWPIVIFAFSHKACILTEHVFQNKDFLCLGGDGKELKKNKKHFAAF